MSSLNKVKKMIKSVNFNELYKIGAYEIIILFVLLFFTYTMPMTVYKFTSSLFGKLVALGAIVFVSYNNIKYGAVLAALFLFISEIGYLQEGFSEKADNNIGENVEVIVKEKETKPDDKDAFFKEHCSAEKKTNFNLKTILKDYTGLVFTEGVCDPCDKTCRYTINNTSQSAHILDTNIKPKELDNIDKL